MTIPYTGVKTIHVHNISECRGSALTNTMGKDMADGIQHKEILCYVNYQPESTTSLRLQHELHPGACQELSLPGSDSGRQLVVVPLRS